MSPQIEQRLRMVRDLFAEIVKSSSEQISRKEALRIIGSEDEFRAIRSALLATGKVEPVKGRGGGLRIRLVQGNRRQWGEAAAKAARHILESWQPVSAGSSKGKTAFEQLEEVTDYWSQSRIAEALGVSQGSVSNWLQKGVVADKYAEAIGSLLQMLKKEEAAAENPESVGSEDEPYAELEETPYAEWLSARLDEKEMDAVSLAKASQVHVSTILALLEGRTERPQKRTRKKIEHALGAKTQEETAETVGDWYYIGLPWTKDEIEQTPDEPGVYIVHDWLGRPAYVGVAHSGRGGIRSRLQDHNEKRWTSDRRVASRFSYALTGRMPRDDDATLAQSIERILIKFMGNSILINERGREDVSG